MRKKYVYILILITLALIAFWQFTPKYYFNPILVTKPKIGPAIQAIYATGTVEGTIMLPLAPRNSARITTLHVDEGDNVQSRQLLAELENEDLQLAIKEQEARLKFAQSSFERQTMLSQRNATSKDALESAQAELVAYTALLDKLKTQAEYYRIYSPSEALIIKRDGELGQLVTPNDQIFWISTAPLRITAEVDEEDIALVKPGQKVTISADAFPNDIYYGVVKSITPKGDPIARSYRVRISLPETSPFKIGMTTENNIVVNTNKRALLIPSSSIIKNKVMIINNSMIEEKEVNIGARGNEYTEIKQGLGTEDLVILNPANELIKQELISYKIINPD